ncbi:unnamed protein product, partial [Musa acuminata var. zebrina]
NAPPSSAAPCYLPSSYSDLVLDDLRRLSVVSDRASVCLAAVMERLCLAESPRFSDLFTSANSSEAVSQEKQQFRAESFAR